MPFFSKNAIKNAHLANMGLNIKKFNNVQSLLSAIDDFGSLEVGTYSAGHKKNTLELHFAVRSGVSRLFAFGKKTFAYSFSRVTFQ